MRAAATVSSMRVCLAALIGVIAVALAGCGGASKPASGAGLTIDITIAHGQVTPSNATLQATVRQPITLHVNSDATDELHVHSVPDHKFEVAAAADWFRRTTAPNQCDRHCPNQCREEYACCRRPHAAFGGTRSNAGSSGCVGAVSSSLIRPAPHVRAETTHRVRNSTTTPPAVNSHAGTPGSRSR